MPGFAQQTLPPGTQSPDAPATDAAPAANAATVPPELAAIEDKIGAQQYDAAKPSLLGFVQAHPSDARALYDLGFLEQATQQDAAAEADYRKAIAADPLQFEARLALGLMLARRGEDTAAHEQLLAATQRDPATEDKAAQAEAYRALAQLDMSMKTPNAAEARQALLGALRLSPETAGDLLLAARIASANGDDETAEASYRQLLEREPGSVEGMAGLAHLFVAQKKYDEAEPLLRSALAKLPDDPGLNMQMASLLAAEGKTEESIEALTSLHAKQPGNEAVDRMLADAYMAAHQPALAEPLLASLLKARPDDQELLDAEGQALTEQQRYKEAEAVFTRGATLYPADVDSWNGVAFTSSALKDDQLTLKALATRAKLSDDTPATLFLWATSYDRLRDVKAAAEYYKKFLAAANGKFPDQEWQAQHRLVALGQTR